MAIRDLPRVEADMLGQARPNGHHDGRRGTAYVRPTEAYEGVPILVQPTWQREISAYFYFGGISAGAYMLGTIADLVGGKHRRKLSHTAHYVAFATALPCAPLLIADLGKPRLFHHMLRIFKPSSPMNLGAWTLTVHSAISTLATLRILADEDKVPLVGGLVRALLPKRALLVAGIPSALTLGGYTGVLLGTTSVPVWFKSPLLAGLFMASAFSTGAAATSLSSTLTGREGPGDHHRMSTLGVALGVTELATYMGYMATSGPARQTLRHGPLGSPVLKASTALLAVGTTLEAVSLLPLPTKRSKLFSALGAASTLAGGALLRWGIVRAGHDSATDREETIASTQPTARAPGWSPTTGG